MKEKYADCVLSNGTEVFILFYLLYLINRTLFVILGKFIYSFLSLDYRRVAEWRVT